MNLPKCDFHTNSKLAEKILPNGFNSIMLFGTVFSKLPKLTDKQRLHENTHVAQWQDCVALGFVIAIISLCTLLSFDIAEYWMYIFCPLPFVLFYILYGLEFMYNRYIKKQSSIKAYLNISFEKHARHCAATWNEPCERQNFYQSFDWWRTKFPNV